MIKLAFSTLACPTWDWPQVLSDGIRYGYQGVEVRQLAGETDLLKVAAFRPTQRAIRRVEMQNAGFAICGLASSVRFDFDDRNKVEEQLRIGMAYAELAAELQARFVRVFGDVLPPPTDPQRESVLEQIADGLNRLGEMAARYRVEVLLETHGDFAQTSLVLDLFENIESKAVAVLWDTHHPWRFFAEPLKETCAALGGRIRHTHWKDSVACAPQPPIAAGSKPATSIAAPSHSVLAREKAAGQAKALMSGHRHADYVLYGEGEFPIDECLQVLRAAGYAGWYSLEWEKMWHPEIPEPEVALPLFPQRMRAAFERLTNCS